MTDDVDARLDPAVRVDSVDVRVFEVPTEQPEADGTLAWDSTTCVVVIARAADRHGLGWTYAAPAVAELIRGTLADAVRERPVSDVGAAWRSMVARTRNLGPFGLARYAISAVDIALWDLKARLAGVCLADLLQRHHDDVACYGSGGFTTLDDDRLTAQLTGWVDRGIPAVKMKVGADPDDDPRRVALARQAVGDDVELMVDGNGAYTRTQAAALAQAFGAADVRWFEEPVTSDDLHGLAWLRDHVPPAMEVAAGEYGTTDTYFAAMLDAQAVDCLQADVTRCGGVTGFLRVGALCDAAHVDLSAHCAPQLSAHAGTAVWHFRHVEYFHDHACIERLLFDGSIDPAGGRLRPDRDRPGLGVELKGSDIAAYEI